MKIARCVIANLAFICLLTFSSGGFSATEAAEFQSADAPAKSEQKATVEDIFNEGKKQLDNGQYEQAIKSFLKCIDRSPPDDGHLFLVLDNLGLAYTQGGHTETGIGYFLESIALAPKYVKSRGHLAAAYRQKGDLSSSISAGLEAIKVDPKYFLTYDEMWKSYAALGRQYGYDEELMLREVYYLERLFEFYPSYERQNPLALKELGYLSMHLADQLAKTSQVAEHARVFAKGISQMSENELKKFSAALKLPVDGISKEEKLKILEKAKARFK